MTDSVLFAEHPAGDRVVGQLTLNVEKTLNSLTREMVEIITDRCLSMAPAKKPFVPAVMCRRCVTPVSRRPVAPASTPSTFLLASTA